LVPVVLEVEIACRKRTKRKKKLLKSFEENQFREIDYLWRK
jgi:hypothetical protein